MREIKGDLFNFDHHLAGMVAVTTNGVVTNQGAAVMGKGIALTANKKWLGLDALLGQRIQQHGNKVILLTTGDVPPFVLPTREAQAVPFRLVSFPTKHHWKDGRADIGLIAQSARALVALVNVLSEFDPTISCALPRVGCGEGTGNLRWDDVYSLLAPIFDDRFTVVAP